MDEIVRMGLVWGMIGGVDKLFDEKVVRGVVMLLNI